MRSSILVFVLVLAGCGGPGATPPASSPVAKTPFVSQHIAGLGDPEVVLENQSDVAFTVTLTGKTAMTIEVPPRGQKSLRLKAGTYGYRASAPNILPLVGEEKFGRDTRYSWSFFLIKTTVDDPQFVGTGWHCFEVKIKPLSYYLCGRTKAHCDQLHAAPPNKADDTEIGECETHESVYEFYDSPRDIVVYTLDMDACERVRASYLKQNPDSSKVSACEEKR